MEDKYLKTEEVAELLNVNPETINNYRRRKANPIPFYKIAGGAVRFKWSEVEAWLEKQRSGECA